MVSDKIVRATLWLSVGLNLIAAYGLAFPNNFPATLFDIPTDAPPFYGFLLGYLIAGFAAAYAWAALQNPVSSAIVGVGAMGKIGLFVVTLLLWGADLVHIAPLLITVFELLVGMIWLMWVLDEDSAIRDTKSTSRHS